MYTLPPCDIAVTVLVVVVVAGVALKGTEKIGSPQVKDVTGFKSLTI